MTWTPVTGPERNLTSVGTTQRARSGARVLGATVAKNLAPEPADLRPLQLSFLAAAVFVVSAGYGSLLPLLPAWIAQQSPGASPSDVSRHVGFLSGAYTGGVLVGAPLWGLIADRFGRPRILIVGLIGYVSSLFLLLLPSMSGLWAIYGLRTTAGLFVAAVVPIVPALVAAHTPTAVRARRFAWLGAASLLGFLFGPGLIALANAIASLISQVPGLVVLQTRIVVVLAALLGAGTMLGLSLTLPPRLNAPNVEIHEPGDRDRASMLGLLLLSVSVNFVLSGFELGIVVPGVAMGTLAAAAGLGQTLGSVVGGWLFGSLAQIGFGWLVLPLVAMLIPLLFRPSWWGSIPTSTHTLQPSNRN